MAKLCANAGSSGRDRKRRRRKVCRAPVSRRGWMLSSAEKNQMTRRLSILFLGIFWSCASIEAAPVTFNKDIAPILYANCSSCHRPGEIAPFSLLSYQDAAKRAKLIATVTARRYMPPWKPEPGFGDFADVHRLTDEQIAQIQEWAGNGAPEGSAKD